MLKTLMKLLVTICCTGILQEFKIEKQMTD